MNSINLDPKPPRKTERVMLRLSKEDYRELKALSRKTKLPMATIAYRAMRHVLDIECAKDGAQ